METRNRKAKPDTVQGIPKKPAQENAGDHNRVYLCDRCGHKMVEHQCKVVCLNCGNRFDCSDLNIYFD